MTTVPGRRLPELTDAGLKATANVTDVAFGGKGPHGSDVWLALAGGNSCEARVHMVEVRKSPNHRPNV